ncbi:MAG TPA: hypothetical protein VFS67_05300 [Polyangiaceae bacterium]|nr:hypothetical protein [Polyangiaceae bacterium]
MNVKNWIVIGLTTAAAACIGTIASVSLANCAGPVVSYPGFSSCSASSGASGNAVGQIVGSRRNLTANFTSSGAGDTQARARGFRSTGVTGCAISDDVVDGVGATTSCAAVTSVTMQADVF